MNCNKKIVRSSFLAILIIISLSFWNTSFAKEVEAKEKSAPNNEIIIDQINLKTEENNRTKSINDAKIDELKIENKNNTEKENEEKYIHDLYYGKVPVISILTVIGYIIYALIFNVLYLFYSRKYAEVIPHIIWFGIFITCLLSPVNGEIRYILPAFMSVYILIPMLFRRKYKIKD